MYKKITRIVGLVLALTMVLSVGQVSVFAAKATFNAPTAPTKIDENVITMAAHSQGWITPEVLGINNTTARDSEVPEYYENEKATLENAQSTVAMGVFGSDINEAPNPYLYNYFYNCYARENSLEEVALGEFTLSKDVGGGPMNAAADGGYDQDGQTVCASLYLRPDILLGVGPVKEDGATGYADALSQLPENADTDKENDYEPYQVVYTTEHVYSFLQSMYELSDICADITKETGKTTRYGDPAVITGDMEKFVKGIQSYVIGKIAEDKAEKKTVAVVDASITQTWRDSAVIGENEYVLNTKDMSTQPTTDYSRVAEFVADTSINLVDALKLEAKEGGVVSEKKTSTYYVATADQIAENADVVLFCNVLSSVPENAGDSFSEATFLTDLVENASADNKEAARNIEVLDAAFACVGTLGANSVENLLGMAYYTAYLYPQYVNQFEVIAYWMQNFYHVSDMSTLKSLISTICADSSVLTEYEETYTADISDYKEADVEAIVVEGMQYYAANADSFKDTLLYQNGKTGEMTGWEIDWENGIGKGAEHMNADGTMVGGDADKDADKDSGSGSSTTIIIVVVAVIIVSGVAYFVISSKRKGAPKA